MAKETNLTAQEIDSLFERVNKEKPAKSDIKQFEKVLKETPELWQYAGDVIETTKNLLIRNATQGNYLISRSMSEGYEVIMADLGHREASMLEKLLIQQVAISWLRHGYIEYQYQQIQPQSMTFKKADYWERKLSQSQRRYLRACESLAKIRKMDIKLQVNVATNQVNVAQ